MLEFGNFDKVRNLLTLNLAFTGAEAYQNRRDNPLSRSFPGLRSVIQRLDPKTNLWAAKLSFFLYRDALHANYGPNWFGNFFHGDQHALRHSIGAAHLADQLGFPKELSKLFNAEGIALVVGNGTRGHYDNLNDKTVGMM